MVSPFNGLACIPTSAANTALVYLRKRRCSNDEKLRLLRRMPNLSASDDELRRVGVFVTASITELLAQHEIATANNSGLCIICGSDEAEE